MAKYEFPNYQKLYEEQKSINEELRKKFDDLCVSLRDEFAISIISGQNLQPDFIHLRGLSEKAYRLADGMMKERRISRA